MFRTAGNSHETWATALAKKMTNLNCKKKTYLVQNAGVNGNTTRQALERVHFDVTSHRPDYVIVQFGMNDCNYWKSDFGLPRVSPKAFTANLEEIVKKLTISGTKFCFLNTNHPSQKGKMAGVHHITYDQSNAQYNVLIRNATQKLKRNGYPIQLLDIEKHWLRSLKNPKSPKLEDYLNDDGVHLS